MSSAPIQPTLAASLARRLPFFYGWVIILISFLGVFMMGTTSFWAVPVFIVPMQEDTGWSHASIFGGLAARFIVGATGGLLFGRLADQKGGASRLLLFGVLVDACALLSLRWADSSLMFILIYGFVGGAGSTGSRLVQNTLLSKWYVARRGAAVGIASNGGGVSALIMAPATALLISELGWRDAWGALGVITLILLLPLVPFAVRAPEDLGLEPDNGVTQTSSRRMAASERSFAVAEIIRKPVFWLLLVGVLFGNFSLQTHTVAMVPYFEEIGFSSATAASTLSIYGLFSIAMRVAWGLAADRLGARNSIIAQSILTAIGALVLLQVSSTASLYVAMAFQGMVLSGFPPLQILMWPEFFGRAHVGAIIGLTQFFSTIAGAAGTVIAGLIFDLTGTYEITLWLLVVTWLSCMAVMLTVRPREDTPVEAST